VRDTGVDVLHRLLDVTFQYLGRLLVVLVLVPAIVLTLGLLLDRTQQVTARLWADTPAVLADSPYAQPANGMTPADRQVALLGELLQTDSFVAAVVREAKLDGPTDPTAIGTDLRKNLYVGSEGPHVMVLIYSTAHPDRGLVLMRAVVTTFQQAQQSVQEGQVSIADQALTTQLRTARKEMDDAITAAQQYRAAHGPDTTLASDAHYQSLRQLANLKVDNYNTLQQQADKATQYQSAIPAVQPGALRVLDQPTAAPWQLSLRGSATKNAGLALVAVLAIELAFVYNVTRRDQRVRTTQDVVATLGLRSMGTVPRPTGKGAGGWKEGLRPGVR
jgi:hypothetical protein